MYNVTILNDTQRNAVQRCTLGALKEFDRLCKKHHVCYTLAYGTLLGAIRHKGFIPWDDDIDVCVSRTDIMKLRSFANTELKSGFFYQTHSTDKDWYRLYDKIRVDGTIFREIAHENENIHQGIYIDIFPLDNIPSNIVLKYCKFLLYKVISTILSSKFINVRQRSGYKYLVACFISFFFYPVKNSWLYKTAEKIASYTTKGDFIRNYESPYNEILSASICDTFSDVVFEKEIFKSFSNYDYWLRLCYGDYMKKPPVENRVTRHAISELKLPE